MSQSNFPPLRWYQNLSWWARTLLTPFLIALPFFLIVFPSAGPIVIPFYIVFPLAIGAGLVIYQEPYARRAPSILPQMNHADSLLFADDYSKAVSAYTDIINTYPDYHRAHAMRAAAYRALGQFDMAQADIDRALEIKPGDPRARAEQARLQNARGDSTRA